jgi:hypothetical protein
MELDGSPFLHRTPDPLPGSDLCVTRNPSEDLAADHGRPTPSLPAWGLRGLPYVLLGKPFLPPILNFLVTNRCTLQCRHCFNWQTPAAGPELTLEEIERISAGLGPLAFLILAGGEPFLRKDVPLFSARTSPGSRPPSTGATACATS